MADKPADRPKVPDVRAAVEAYYALRPENICGGSLHIVTDDGNVEDSSVEFCREYAREHGDTAGVALAELLLQMTHTQRRKVYQTHRGHLASFITNLPDVPRGT